MIVISDAGPLIALAKIGSLPVIFQLSSMVLIPPAVFEETVVAGLRLGLADAESISSYHAGGQLLVVPVQPTRLELPEEVDPGEREGILLALQEQADWLLVDDLRARAVAEAIFASQGVKTRVRGTLGLLVEAFRQGVLTRSETIERLRALEAHPDIWLHESLIRWAIDAISQTRD
ncbi:MAG TPA: hypothetical protein VN783_09875 [Thermoanaerobaculia bacterium]|nr:hypothetical protein [Thermoanaerobaculia bacterium]